MSLTCKASSVSDVAVTLFSVGNGLGRVFTSSLSDLAHRRRLCPRPLCLAMVFLAMAAAHIILALRTGIVGLYIGVFLAACAFGSTWPLTVVITSELWGSDHHGANYMLCDGIIQMVGALLVGKFIAQSVYTAELEAELAAAGGAPAHANASSSGEMAATTCHGHACFELTHWSVVVLCLCGACAVAAVGYRSRGHYKTMWALEAQDLQLRMERRAKQ